MPFQSGQPSEIEAMEARERMQAMLANITENNETGLRYRADIEANENHRRSIQEKINSAMESYSSTSFLQVLSTFRMQAVRLQELQFQMAVRDQVINEQRDVISNLWRLIEGAGLNQQQIQAIALQQGILVEGLSGPDMDGNLSAARDSGDSDADNCTPKQIFRGGGGGSNGGGNSMSLANKSIYGARAKYRYDFWQNYDGIGGVDMDDDNMDQENEPPDPHDVRRPSTSQSDHDMRYNSPEPRRPPAAQGTRRSQEQLSSERRCGKESNVGRYNGKASPAKQVRGRGLSYQQKPPPPGTEGPSSSDVAATEARQRPRHSSGRRGGVVHGRRGGGATGASSATQGGEDDSQDAIGTEWSEPVMGRSAWGEDDKGKPDKPDLFVGSDAARGRDREREAPVGGRLMSQLGRLKARRSASDRYPQSQAQAQAQPSQQALGPSVDLDALRIDGSTAAQPVRITP